MIRSELPARVSHHYQTMRRSATKRWARESPQLLCTSRAGARPNYAVGLRSTPSGRDRRNPGTLRRCSLGNSANAMPSPTLGCTRAGHLHQNQSEQRRRGVKRQLILSATQFLESVLASGPSNHRSGLRPRGLGQDLNAHWSNKQRHFVDM